MEDLVWWRFQDE